MAEAPVHVTHPVHIATSAALEGRSFDVLLLPMSVARPGTHLVHPVHQSGTVFGQYAERSKTLWEVHEEERG